MAVPRESSVGRSRGGFRGTWFWLAAIFGATLFATTKVPHLDAVLDFLGDQWLMAVAVIIGWSVAWGILGAILAAVAPGPASSVYRLSSRTLFTVAVAVLLAREMAQGPSALADPRQLLVGLGLCGAVGALWWLLIDLPRVAFWRFSRRPRPPLLSVANLAVLAGLVTVAVVLQRDLAGRLQGAPMREGVTSLMIVGAVAVSLTLFLELPRAMLLRARTELGAESRAHIVGALRTVADRAARAVPAAHVVPKPRAAEQHGRIATPPTVVRRH